jgi:branched-chain amino acid aminotransferase
MPKRIFFMIVKEQMIEITKTTDSRLPELDFDNLRFGREFSDHMFEMDYAEGKWQTPRIVPFANLNLNPAVSVIHYGQSIFEGMKAYKNKDGEVYLFRPEKNVARFNVSAERMCMPEVDEDLLKQAIVELVKLDEDWIPERDGSSLYIRPFMFATDEYIGIQPSSTYKLLIFTCPVNAYYAGPVRVKIEEKYTRSVEGGTGYAKAAGNYAAALYPAKLAQEEGYHQLIWTDAKEHKWIEESGTMNVIFRIGNGIISPKPSDTILDGVTRESVLQLASDWGYNVEHRRFSVDELRQLLEANKLDEAFGAGTAATIAPISTIGYSDHDFDLTEFGSWDFGPKVLAHIENLKRGLCEDPHNWRFRIC